MNSCLPYVITLSIFNVVVLAIFANYNIKIKEKQIILEKKVEAQNKKIEELEQNGKVCSECSKNK